MIGWSSKLRNERRDERFKVRRKLNPCYENILERISLFFVHLKKEEG